MYKGFLGKCGFSDYMLDYLHTAELSVRNAVEIVLYAPVSIYTKLDELKKIYAIDEKDTRDGLPEAELRNILAML